MTLFLIFYNYKQSLKYIKRKLIRPIYYQRGILHYEFFFCNLTFIFTVKCDILQDITSFIFCSVFIYLTNETTRVHYISIVSCFGLFQKYKEISHVETLVHSFTMRGLCFKPGIIIFFSTYSSSAVTKFLQHSTKFSTQNLCRKSV